MGNTSDERRKRRQAWASIIKVAFRDVDKHERAVPFKYAALEIQKILDQENPPTCDVYEMIAEDMYRGRFSVSSRSQVLYWDEDVAQKITSENFERVLIPIIDALDDREEAIKFLIDRCWTRWDVLDRWCDFRKLPRIERLDKSDVNEGLPPAAATAGPERPKEKSPAPANKIDAVAMACALLFPGGDISPLLPARDRNKMIVDWIKQNTTVAPSFSISDRSIENGINKFKENRSV